MIDNTTKAKTISIDLVDIVTKKTEQALALTEMLMLNKDINNKISNSLLWLLDDLIIDIRDNVTDKSVQLI